MSTAHRVASLYGFAYVETPGFELTEVFARSSGVGGGVQVQDVERISDRFLELRALQDHATDGSLQQTKSILGRVELAFAEPGDNGLQAPAHYTTSGDRYLQF